MPAVDDRNLEARIRELETQIQQIGSSLGSSINLGRTELVGNFSAGSCTNECTAACTIGCTKGCTSKGCATGVDIPQGDPLQPAQAVSADYYKMKG